MRWLPRRDRGLEPASRENAFGWMAIGEVHLHVIVLSEGLNVVFTAVAVQYTYLSHSLGLAPLKMYGELQCNMGPY